MAIRTYVSLFSGAGGLDLAIRLVAPEARCLVYVEREAYAAAVLAARCEEGTLDPAPIWSDVCTFDGRGLRGSVDLIIGGFPCQDISNAGNRAGLDGARSGLWYEYARIVGEVRPRFVVIENVAALVGRGLDRVLDSLAALGYDAEWGCYRASDVGAPHKRERLFLLAHTHEHGQQGQGIGRARLLDGIGPPRGHDAHGCGSAELGNTNSERLEGRSQPLIGSGYQRSAWPPGPTELDQWAGYLRLRPNLEPSVCGGTHGLAGGLEHRIDRLRLIGNGVVPQVAALAFVDLWNRAFGPGVGGL